MWDMVSLQLIFNGGARSKLRVQKQNNRMPAQRSTRPRLFLSMYHTHMRKTLLISFTSKKREQKAAQYTKDFPVTPQAP